MSGTAGVEVAVVPDAELAGVSAAPATGWLVDQPDGAAAELVAGLRTDLGYALTLARDDEADRPLEGRARHRGTFRVSYGSDRLGSAGQVRGPLVGRRPFHVDENADGVVETEQADRHATVGLRLSQLVWRKIEVFLGGDNLLGAGDERHLPVPPRTFYGGLDFRM